MAEPRWRRYLRFKGSNADADIDDELRFHVEARMAECQARGLTRDEAERAARARFGDVDAIASSLRRHDEAMARRAGTRERVQSLARDVRYAVRRIRRAPAFAGGVIATLGIGLGAAVGIGTIVYGVLLRDLPYARPDQLVCIGFHTDGLPASGDLHSAATFIHFALSARSFTDLGAYVSNDAFALTDGDAAERVTVALMSPSTFDLLRVRPLLGALFARKDTAWVGVDHFLPVLISQGIRERRYGADPKIIERRKLGLSRMTPAMSFALSFLLAPPVAQRRLTNRALPQVIVFSSEKRGERVVLEDQDHIRTWMRSVVPARVEPADTTHRESIDVGLFYAGSVGWVEGLNDRGQLPMDRADLRVKYYPARAAQRVLWVPQPNLLAPALRLRPAAVNADGVGVLNELRIPVRLKSDGIEPDRRRAGARFAVEDRR